MTAGEQPRADELRRRVYALLGSLLAGPSHADLLKRLAGIEGDAHGEALARAWSSLGAAARSADPARLDDEYHDLFIGITRGELVPYASWYLTGLLMEQPLADLRDDLQVLGIERQAAVSEPEDHIAALCQTMALLTDPRAGVEYGCQQVFVARHLAPWAKQFFDDLCTAKHADFYKAVGQLGRAFIDLEWRYLELDDVPISSGKRAETLHEQV